MYSKRFRHLSKQKILPHPTACNVNEEIDGGMKGGESVDIRLDPGSGMIRSLRTQATKAVLLHPKLEKNTSLHLFFSSFRSIVVDIATVSIFISGRLLTIR